MSKPESAKSIKENATAIADQRVRPYRMRWATIRTEVQLPGSVAVLVESLIDALHTEVLRSTTIARQALSVTKELAERAGIQ